MMTWKIFYSTKCCVLFLLFNITSSFVVAQRHTHEKLESVRIALITERLALTPETAQKFWPIYNQINDERTKLKRDGFRWHRADDTAALTNKQAQEHIDAYFDLKKRELTLEEDAIDKYATVLSPVQVLQLLKVERDFQRMMLKQLGRRGRKSANDQSPKRPRTPNDESKTLSPNGAEVDEDDIF